MARTRNAWRSGPRLPRRSLPAERDELPDPAEGAAVPRCRVCGMPDRPDNRLLVGTWSLAGYRMQLVLCERELPPFDPRAGDPLTVA